MTPAVCRSQPSVYVCSPLHALPLRVETALVRTTLDAFPESASTGTMSNQYTPPSASLVLPTVTTILGLTGLATGANTFLYSRPIDATRAFGLQSPGPTHSSTNEDPLTTALVHAYGTRNIGGALGTLGLTAFWQMQSKGSVAEIVARRCLGLSMLLSTVVGIGDALLVNRFGGEVGGDVGVVAKKAAFGHGIAAVIIAATGLKILWI